MEKKWQVIDKETRISVRFYEDYQEAKAYADWMTSYHRRDYIVIPI